MTSSLPRLHGDFIATLIALLEPDRRFLALLGGGSLVHGGFDEHSDLDFVLVAEDGDYAGALASRQALAEAAGPLLAAFGGEHVGEPRLLVCLYGPPLLHVDFKLVNAADLDRRIERPTLLWARDPAAVTARLDAAEIEWPDRDPDWFEARAWIWLHYGIAKARRGELFEAIGMLAFFREQVLGPMLHRRAGRPQRGVRRIEAAGVDAGGRLAATVAGHDAGAVIAALRSAIDLYLDLRGDSPPTHPVQGMPAALGIAGVW